MDTHQFELGTWLGRKQAFGLVASRCSAADAECLRKIRDEKMYKSLKVSWEEFCRKHVGITRRYADEIIAQLEEFGTTYFHLSQFMRLAPDTFRLISGAVSEQGIEFSGEKIPITPENSKKLHTAIKSLRESRMQQSEQQKVANLQKRFEALCAELFAVSDRKLDAAAHASLEELVADGAKKLAGLLARIRLAA